LQFEIRRTNVLGLCSSSLREALEINRKVFPPEQFEDADFFYFNVRSGYYGDDFFQSVSNLLKEIFNMQILEIVFSFLGHKVTTGAKREVTQPFVQRSEFEILKRQPVWCKSAARWVLALKEDTIRDIPNWTRRSAYSSNFYETKENFETALREMSLHGEEKYENFANQYSPHLFALVMDANITPYRTMLRKYVSAELFGAYKI